MKKFLVLVLFIPFVCKGQEKDLAIFFKAAVEIDNKKRDAYVKLVNEEYVESNVKRIKEFSSDLSRIRGLKPHAQKKTTTTETIVVDTFKMRLATDIFYNKDGKIDSLFYIRGGVVSSANYYTYGGDEKLLKKSRINEENEQKSITFYRKDGLVDSSYSYKVRYSDRSQSYDIKANKYYYYKKGSEYIMESKSYDNDFDYPSYSRSFYNSLGQIVKSHDFTIDNNEESIIWSNIYSYKKGHDSDTINCNMYYYDKLIWETTEILNKEGRLVSETRKSDGEIEQTSYAYVGSTIVDEKRIVIKLKGDLHTICIHNVYEYDDRGNWIKLTRYGNMCKENFVFPDKPIGVKVREITYY